jgi:hypothetical protein
MALAHSARTGVGLERGRFGFEPDVATKAASRMCLPGARSYGMPRET